jgi:hypothetical protein
VAVRVALVEGRVSPPTGTLDEEMSYKQGRDSCGSGWKLLVRYRRLNLVRQQTANIGNSSHKNAHRKAAVRGER